METNSLEARIDAIEHRNARVEQDKQWETSWVRKCSIAGLTYIVMSTYMYTIHGDAPFLSATIPTLGYLLSTFAISRVRNYFESSSTPYASVYDGK